MLNIPLVKEKRGCWPAALSDNQLQQKTASQTECLITDLTAQSVFMAALNHTSAGVHTQVATATCRKVNKGNHAVKYCIQCNS